MKKKFLAVFTIAILPCFFARTGLAEESQKTGTAGFLYVVNSSSNNVVGYKLATDGRASQLAGFSFSAGTAPVAVIAHPSGRFVYAANSRSHNIVAYRVGESGALDIVVGSPFPTGTTPREMAMDAEGRYLFVLNADSQNISAYRINPNSGTLTAVAGSPFGAGTRPIKIVVFGKFLYVLNSGSDNISLFSIQESGTLRAAGHIATGTTPSAFVFIKPFGYSPNPIISAENPGRSD